jgi:UDP-glucose:(heptosyl)LPS alpha-1,3-glucosyltransferase
MSGDGGGIVFCTPMNSMPANTRLYILRRVSGGHGGAELVVQRFGRMFGDEYQVVPLSDRTLGLQGNLTRRLLPRWWRPIRYAKRVDAYLRAEAPGIVLSLERGPACMIYRAGDGVHRRWLRIKGGLGHWFNPLHWILPVLENRSMVKATVVVANSEMVRRDLARFHPACESKIRVIRNGVDSSRFCWREEDARDVRGRIGWTADGEHWLFVGSGWERKGLAVALRLLSHRLRRGPQAGTPSPMLHVVGSGRSKRFQSLAARLGVSAAVEFHGPKRDLQDWYSAADLMVLPTAYDPCSNATLEALACGCPVVTTKTNGASEAITISEAGLTIDAERPDVQRLDEWLDGNLKRADRNRIAKSMAAWTQDRERGEYESLFEDVRCQ